MLPSWHHEQVKHRSWHWWCLVGQPARLVYVVHVHFVCLAWTVQYLQGLFRIYAHSVIVRFVVFPVVLHLDWDHRASVVLCHRNDYRHRVQVFVAQVGEQNRISEDLHCQNWRTIHALGNWWHYLLVVCLHVDDKVAVFGRHCYGVGLLGAVIIVLVVPSSSVSCKIVCNSDSLETCGQESVWHKEDAL